jgi:hypothetical protein
VDVGTLPSHVNSMCIVFFSFSLYFSLNCIVSTIPNMNFLLEWSFMYTRMAPLNCICRNSVLHIEARVTKTQKIRVTNNKLILLLLV